MVFHRYDQDAVILAVDVDDITIAGDSKRGVKRFKEQLGMRYKIKDMGDLNWLLGLEVTRDRGQRMITFGQCIYPESNRPLQLAGCQAAFDPDEPWQ